MEISSQQNTLLYMYVSLSFLVELGIFLVFMTFSYVIYRAWKALDQWSHEKFLELASCSRTENFGYNKVVVGNSLENSHLWFCVEVIGENVFQEELCPDIVFCCTSCFCIFFH